MTVTVRRSPEAEGSEIEVAGSRFPPELLYRAARLYYVDEATQAEVAEALETSRPTVSRLLAEARALGIVHIEVREPKLRDTGALAARLADRLGLRRAWVSASAADGYLGEVLAPSVAAALRAAELSPGDALLVSSGRTVQAMSRQALPPLPEVLLAPMVGGRDEPEECYQTNEITRRLAVAVGGTPVLLYAPALPGPDLYEHLVNDESVQRVTRLWSTARAAMLGIGAPLDARTSVPTMMDKDRKYLGGAVGDICARPYDRDGEPIVVPGQERMIAMRLDDLRQIPHAIGIAVGRAKLDCIRTAARRGYINELVTDLPTAQLLVETDDSD